MAAHLDAHITMADLLAGWPGASATVVRRGMACIGCPMARFETLAEASAAYGFDPDDFLKEVAAGRDDSVRPEFAPPQRRTRARGR